MARRLVERGVRFVQIYHCGWDVHSFAPEVLPAQARDVDRAAWARQEEQRLWRHLAEIPCPTLVIRGEHSDVLSARTQERMVNEGLPNGRAVTIPGAGHVVMLDAPESLRRELGAFLLDPPAWGAIH